MSRLRLLALAAVAVLALSVGAGAAVAATSTKLSPAADCKDNHGRLTQDYTAKQLQTALNQMSSVSKEYTGCYNLIQDKLNADLGKGGTNVGSLGGSGGGGSGTVILIVVIVVVLLGGGGAAFWAYRRNRGGPGSR